MIGYKFKAIVSDIDGTLTPIIPNALPSKNVTSAIKKAVKTGLIFSLASGRPFFLVKYLTAHLGKMGPCIVDNGAVIVDSKDGTVLWEAVLSNNDANRILKLSRHFDLVRASCNTGGIDNPTTIPESSKTRKISVHDITKKEAEKLINTVTNELKNVTGIKAASYKGDHLVDVYFSDINATKQYAVLKLAEILNISHKEIIGVGDGYNDFPLLMACGLKVAMGNAIDEIKEIADYVAPSVEQDGLVDVLKKYCL